MYTDHKYDVFKFVKDFCHATAKSRVKPAVMDIEELFRAAYISNRGQLKNEFATRWNDMSFWDHLQYVLFLAQDCDLLPESTNVQKDTVELLKQAKEIIDENLKEDAEGYIPILSVQGRSTLPAHYRFLNPRTELIYDNLSKIDRTEIMKKLNPEFRNRKMTEEAEKNYWDEIVENDTIIQIKIEATHHFLTLDEFKTKIRTREIKYPNYRQENAYKLLEACRYDSLFLYDYIYDSGAPLPSNCDYFPRQVCDQLMLERRSEGVYQDVTNGTYYLRSNDGDIKIFLIKQGIPDEQDRYVCNNTVKGSEPKNVIKDTLANLQYKPLSFGFAVDYDRIVSMLNYTLSSYENLGRADRTRYHDSISRRMSSNIDSEDNTYYRFGRMSSRRHGMRSMSEESNDIWKGGNFLFEYLRSQQPPAENNLEEGDLPNEWSNLMKASHKSKTGKAIHNPARFKKKLRDDLEKTYDNLQKKLSVFLDKINKPSEKIWYIVPYDKTKMTCAQYLRSIGYTDVELNTLRTTPTADPDLQDGKALDDKEEVKDRFIRLPEPHLIDPDFLMGMNCDEETGEVKFDKTTTKVIDQFVKATKKDLIPLLVGKFSRPKDVNNTFYSDSIKLKAGISAEDVPDDLDLRVPFQLFDGLLLNVRSELAQQQDILFKYALEMEGSKLLVDDGSNNEYPYTTCTTVLDVQVNTGFVGYKELLVEGTKAKERSIIFMCDNEHSYSLRDVLRGRVRGVSWSANVASDVDKDKWFIFEQHVNLLHYWRMLYCLLVHLLNKARDVDTAGEIDVALADNILLMLLELSNVNTTDMIEGLNVTMEEFNNLSYENRFKLFLEKYQTIIAYIQRVIKTPSEQRRVINAVRRTLRSAAAELNVDFVDSVIPTLQPLRIIIGRDNPPDLRSPAPTVSISSGGRRKPGKKVRRS